MFASASISLFFSHGEQVRVALTNTLRGNYRCTLLQYLLTEGSVTDESGCLFPSASAYEIAMFLRDIKLTRIIASLKGGTDLNYRERFRQNENMQKRVALT